MDKEKKLIRGVTKSGFRFSVDPEIFRDLELLELIGEIDEGNVLVLPKVLTKIFGKRQKDNLYAFCKKKAGFVDIEMVTEVLKEVLSEDNIKNV